MFYLIVLFIFSSCQGPCTSSYVPGTPGAAWTDQEVPIVRQKVLEIMKAENWHPLAAEPILALPKGRTETWPNENKLLRLAFHDCLKYVDGSGGCDGCLNMKNMGFKYMNFFTSGIKPPSEIKPEYYYEPFKTTDNNDLEGTAMALEMIYTTHDWPLNTPNLTTTLLESGKSRADLWAFATLVALEQTIERANYACDHDYHVRQQITLLEGRDKCDIKLTEPIKFRYGRSDCIPEFADKPYAAAKVESHPMFSGTAEQVFSFMAKDFDLSERDTIALMGIHSVSRHGKLRMNRVAGFKYLWLGAPYLSTMYYKYMANRPLFLNPDNLNLYHGNPSNTVAVGDVEGNPVASTNWRAHCNHLWNTTDGGPCFWRPTFPTCPERNPNSGVWRQNCAGRSDQCCEDAEFDDNGVQRGGCQAGEDCSFNMMFALNLEVGFYKNFSITGDASRATGCPGLVPSSEYNGAPIFGSPVEECDKARTASIVEEFADDHDVWAEAFLNAWQRMQNNVENKFDLKDGPQSSWLGYYSLEGRVDVGDFAQYIAGNAPLVFSNPDVDPTICGECEQRFSNA